MTTQPSTIFRAGVAGACGYEAVAITTRKVLKLPTISALCGRYIWPIPIIIGGLTWHLVSGIRRKAALRRAA